MRSIVGLIASGATPDDILDDYPYLERDDITATLSYAARRVEEIYVPITRPSRSGVRCCRPKAEEVCAGRK